MLYAQPHDIAIKDHTMKTLTSFRRPLVAALLLMGALELAGCGHIEYRCPLDPSKTPESPTACAGMNEALAGARAGSGGKVSVLLDNKGRLVPTEMRAGRPAQPLQAGAGNAVEPYNPDSGSPVFHEPKVYKAWASAFVDANGTLHDGHSAWFTTPGRWAYGTVDHAGEGSDNLLKPASPLDAPHGSVVQEAGPGVKKAPASAAQNHPAPQATQQDRDKAALQTLSTVANSAAKTAQAAQAAHDPGAGSVTQPAVKLGQ